MKIDRHVHEHDFSVELEGIYGREKAEEQGRGRLNVGEEYSIALLSLDAVGHTELMRKYPVEKIRPVLEGYRELVAQCIDEYGGDRWSWAGDGGLYAFWGRRRCERAVLAGIQLLHEMAVFNLDAERNSLGHPIKVRVSAGEGTCIYKEPVGEIFGLFINETVKLQEKRTRAGEFNIYEEVFYAVRKEVQDVFFKIGAGFNRKNIFTYRGVPNRKSPRSGEIKDAFGSLSNQVTEMLADFSAAFEAGRVSEELVSKLHKKIREYYLGLDKFRGWFEEIDGRWSPSYFKKMAQVANNLLILEGQLWSGMKAWIVKGIPDSGARHEFDLLKEFVKHNHVNNEIAISSLHERFLEGAAVKLESEGLGGKISRFLNSDADDLDKIAAFVSVMRHDREELLRFAEEKGAHFMAGLSEGFWIMSDLVLAEDFYERSRGSDLNALFNLLVANSAELNPRFRILDSVLKEEGVLRDFVVGKFRAAGVEPTHADIDIVWRSIVVAHTGISARFQAAMEAPLSALWQLAAYQRTPLVSLWVIAQRVKDKEDEDLKKIFYDCVRPRLFGAIEDGAGFEIDIVGKIISLLFDFEFFVESSYFRDLEALFAMFRARAVRFGKDISVYEKNLKLIENLRKLYERKGRNSTLPGGVGALPLPIQKHLARHGSYVEFFACHEDLRIAREVKRFLNDEVLERLARYCAENGLRINGELERSLVGVKRDLFLSKIESYGGGREIEEAKESEQPGRVDRFLEKKLTKQELEEVRRRLGRN